MTDNQIVLIDVFISTVHLLLDEDDDRPVMERLAGIDEIFERWGPRAELAFASLEYETSQFTALASALQRPEFQRFSHRLIGQGRVDALSRAGKSDIGSVMIGLRRGVRAILHFATALDDCCEFTSAEKILALPGENGLGGSLLQMAIKLDFEVSNFLDADGVIAEVITQDKLFGPLVEDPLGDLTTIAARMHEIIDGKAAEMLGDLSEALGRKVRGAQEALQHSVDGVSQCANSLVEFIDRLFRSAFSESEVVQWIRRNYPDRDELLFVDSATTKLRPTKRGQALCFVAASRDQGSPNFLNEMAALGIAETRQTLQKLKHADSGSKEERRMAEKAIDAVEGFVVYAIQVGWIGIEEAEARSIQLRIAG